MYMIDYGTSWYDRNFHNREDDLEYRVDKVLSFLNYVCYLRKEKNLGKKEFRILCYEVNRVCISPDIQNYLWNLYHFSVKQGTECSFQDLIEYGMEKRIIDRKSFLSSTSENNYTKYLNF